LPWLRILIAPLPFFHPDVARSRNHAYGGSGKRSRASKTRTRASLRPSGSRGTTGQSTPSASRCPLRPRTTHIGTHHRS
jgi:hypothetical protein